MAEPTLFNRVRLTRMGSALERCHKKPHTLRYSVGHHTHDLVSLLVLCWMEAHGGALPRAELIVSAHAHDHPEIVVGDIPSPTKDLIGQPLVEIEERVEAWLGLQSDLTDEEALYLAAADRFELWLWCYEEAQRGNVNFMDWAAAYEARWRDAPLPWPFMDLMEEVLAHRGVPNLSDGELLDIGGMR